MDSADLYTGLMGNDGPTEEATRELENRAEAAERISPSLDVVMTVIEAERSQVSDIRSYLSAGVSKEAAQDEYRARELYLGFLDRLEGTLKAMLGEYQ